MEDQTESLNTTIRELEKFQEQEDFEEFQREALLALEEFRHDCLDETELRREYLNEKKTWFVKEFGLGLDTINEGCEDPWWDSSDGTPWPCLCCQPLGLSCLCREPGMEPVNDKEKEEKERVAVTWIKRIKSRFSLLITKYHTYKNPVRW